MATVSLYRVVDADLTADSIGQILSTMHGSTEVPLRKALPGRLFLSRSEPRVPEWARYLTSITVSPLDVPARESLGAVLLLKPEARRRLVYAVTWGNGHFLLRSDRLEPDLGLRCALNLISAKQTGTSPWDPARVRSLRSKRVSQNTLITETQASRKAPIDAFPFSADVDQLRRVTGTPTDTDSWGSTVTGGVSLYVKRPEDPQDLVELCRAIERTYRSTRYREHYGWIDNVTQVRDPDLLEKAYVWVVGELRRAEAAAINLSPPSLVSWEETAAFEYQWGRESRQVEEPSLESFRLFLTDTGVMSELSADALRESARLHALDSAGETVGSWSISRCLSGELIIGNDTYVLDDGTLFFVAADYLKSLNSFVKAIPQTALRLPQAGQNEAEGTYNERVAHALPGAILLDKKTVRRPQATAVEICDVAVRSKHLVHIKKGLSSSSLSHLFAQGVVSAELLHMDARFRNQVRAMLRRRLAGSGARRMTDFGWLGASSFNSQACEVAYAIMTGRSGQMPRETLPFFSRVNLRMRCQELRRMGFKYSLALVPTQ